MADSASTLELQQQRALNADTFARQQARQVDPNAYAVSQSERLQTQLDAAQTGTKPVENSTITSEAQKPAGFTGRLAQLRELRSRALGPNPVAVAVEAVNRTYTRYLNTSQSELIANTLALEVVVSPWVFLTVYFLRCIAWAFPIRVKGIMVIPPYSLRGGDIGVFISHTTAALVILTILFLILFLIMFIVWTITEDPITQTKVFSEMSGGVLEGISNLFKAVTSF